MSEFNATEQRLVKKIAKARDIYYNTDISAKDGKDLLRFQQVGKDLAKLLTAQGVNKSNPALVTAARKIKEGGRYVWEDVEKLHTILCEIESGNLTPKPKKPFNPFMNVPGL